MKFRHELPYDASPGEVFAMLADADFREKVSAAQDVVSAVVTVEPKGAGFSMRNDQMQRTEGLPGFARKFAGPTTQAVQVEDWPDPSGGSLRIEAPGKPASAGGTIALVADGAGTTEVVELELSVRVPLIGGRLESLLAEQLRKALDLENETGIAWLRREH